MRNVKPVLRLQKECNHLGIKTMYPRFQIQTTISGIPDSAFHQYMVNFAKHIPKCSCAVTNEDAYIQNSFMLLEVKRKPSQCYRQKIVWRQLLMLRLTPYTFRETDNPTSATWSTPLYTHCTKPIRTPKDRRWEKVSLGSPSIDALPWA